MFIVENGQTVIPPTGRKVAIVTITIGLRYIATWHRLCSGSWQAYAALCDFDLIVVSGPLDTGSRAAARSPAWQKLLILSQPWAQQYDRIIWLDSDIIIAGHAPQIMQHAGPPDKISLSIAGDRISDAERMIFLERLFRIQVTPNSERDIWIWEMQKNYRDHKVEEHDYMFNTGVMVLSPQHHNGLFLKCYEGEQADRLYEQPLLSHEIIVGDLAHRISSRFNWGIQETLFLYLPEILDARHMDPEAKAAVQQQAHVLVRRELANAYFLHFYGSMGLMSNMSHADVFGADATAATP
ncbi:MAG: hypothetical protein OJJ21_17580 [Ferrovibrio sp.]|uniref:hypothetical protein n=1 Tax=Ferrovibrio sp. TaxID=1917215 RepID=UPI00262E7DE5|nr:hypothetical protein [Ferrovibrio sp.]MCW0235414.1 hypothetical protein [Ferrovibrio sp.]